MVTKTELFTHTENKDGDDVRIDSEIVCHERQSTYRYINQAGQRIARIRVDGGLVQDTNVEKCDWLLINWDSNHSFFIELKGSDVKKAIRQINATLDWFWLDINGMGIRVAHARIVPGKVPRPDFVRNDRRKLELRLKQYGYGTVKIQAREMTEFPDF